MTVCEGCKNAKAVIHIDRQHFDVIQLCSLFPNPITERVIRCTAFDPLIPVGAMIKDDKAVFKIIASNTFGELIIENTKTKRRKRISPEAISDYQKNIVKENEKNEGVCH
ncbi:MAG: hypothetical protein QXI91_07640 [Candidatus Bathyarchaeia archaeon]